jgi:hypothetical protein
MSDKQFRRAAFEGGQPSPGVYSIMLAPNLKKWNITPETALRNATSSFNHERTRERWLAIYTMAVWSNGATDFARQNPGRNVRTHMEWVNRFNRFGPSCLVYKRTGGRKASPLLTS